MRRAFDGTEIQQKPPMQFQQFAKQQGQPPLHPIRPASAKPPIYNNLMHNNADQQEDQTPYQHIQSVQNYSDNNINSNRVMIQSKQEQSRLYSGGMQRNNSGHRSYENNMQQLNRTAQQLNKINSQLNTSNSGLDTYGGDVAKHMPRIIHQEKEQLYAETLQLKNQINELKESNKTLKTQLYQVERDSVKYKKIVDQYEANGIVKGFYPKTEGGHITENLKKTIKDLKMQLAVKDEENNKIKKQIKYTRLQELDRERKCYAEECTRLKNLLQQALNEKMEVLIKETDYQKLEERLYAQNNEIEQLRYDNTEMAQQLKNYDNQNNYLQRGYNDLERKSNLQITTLRKHLKERDREINELKNELSKFRLQNINNQSSKKDFSNQLPINSNRMARPQSAKNNNLSTEMGFLKKQLEMKDDKIRQLEEDVIQLRHELNTQGNQGTDEYDDDKNQNSTYRENQSQNNQNIDSIQYQKEKNQNQQYENNKNNNNQNEIKIEQHQQQVFPPSTKSKQSSNQIERPEDKKSIDGVLRINSDSNNQYVTRIKREDIVHIGEEVQFKLRSNALNLNEAAQLFFDNLDEQTSIRDLQAMLLDKPFNLQQNDALLFSRYLVEDKDGKYKFDWEYSRKNEQIFQSFSEIVGSYQVFSKGYAQKLYDSLQKIFASNRESIKATLQTKSNGKNTISKEQFIQTFEFLNIQLQKDQVAFLIMAMIQDSVDLNHLYFKNLLKLFKVKHNDNEYQDELEQYQDDYDQEDQLESNDQYEDSNDYKMQEQQYEQNKNTNNQVKMQRPQSSKRRNPLPNNQIEQEDDEYYDQSEQGIEEDNDEDLEGHYSEEDDGYGGYHQINKNINQNNHQINKEEESIIKKYADRKSSNEYEGKIKEKQNQQNINSKLTPQQYDQLLKQKEQEVLQSWKNEDEEEDDYDDYEQEEIQNQKNHKKQAPIDDDLQQYVEDQFEKNHSKNKKETQKQKSDSKKQNKQNKQEAQYEDLYEQEDFDDKPSTKNGSKVQNKKNQNEYEDDFDVISDQN
ncbi:hypothetical protein TTHERM_00382370 (macronuclear) [Tetrahymena thermophila SB210]|uniref:Uncharacterized protein n=1 Tax=Tetrahymena thermophila (strain SB210) TaxID=312017 RepID=Q23F77_TETTS|nr:hypothetical protein TTHERM_00382370 [Tetrahymena thermophila SB210]EAR95276.3 hypothetical protein TTHERM_00382370 [Tetrahymena thermophila SB210]|eukprot:XP_001015521.3 hypothetical protein TTHERM_00382370 [Tetrahymena thermophila SB210]